MTVERNHAITLVLVSRQSFENRSIKISFIFVSTPLKLRLHYLRNGALFALFCWKGDPNDETWWFARKSSTVWPNRRFFNLFCKMRLLLHFFAEKLTQTPTHGGLLEKVASFGKIDDFSCFSAKWGTFCKFLLKSSPKHRNVVLFSRGFYSLAKSTIFHGFSRNEALFATFYWKVDQNGKTW